MVACTNARASGLGAGYMGGPMYSDFVPFDIAEIYRFIGVLFANGVAPKSDMECWFKRTHKDPLLGNNYISEMMDKKKESGGVVSGFRRWKHFRRFMCFYDWRDANELASSNDSLWKVSI